MWSKSTNHKSGLASYQCLIWSGWRCLGLFYLLLAYNLHIPLANEKQARVAEEMYQTLLSIRKPGNNHQVHAVNIIS
jgi:hypothetical protein